MIYIRTSQSGLSQFFLDQNVKEKLTHGKVIFEMYVLVSPDCPTFSTDQNVKEKLMRLLLRYTYYSQSRLSNFFPEQKTKEKLTDYYNHKHETLHMCPCGQDKHLWAK